MIVWRGWGILVPVIAFASALLMQVAVDALAGPGAYTRDAYPWAPVALLLAAPLVWLLGRRFNGRTPRVLVDRETREEVILRPEHAFFWIKMEYWAIILALIAGAVLLLGLGRR
jgi:hypothetical protein